jgi:hypothetical protein
MPNGPQEYREVCAEGAVRREHDEPRLQGTKSMVAEELPDEIARVLTRLKEVTR